MVDKFINFMNGFSAAVHLMERARKNGFGIEYICLSASVIDGKLRIALVLKNQIDKNNNEILDELIFQAKEDKIISEREIYKRALNDNIIKKDLFRELEYLYKQRNRVVHRYIISDIKTDEVYNIGIRYAKIIPLISQEVRKLEDKQIEMGVGMTVSGSEVPGVTRESVRSQLKRMSDIKHGNIDLAKKIKENT
jgi:hypothetical protein